MELKKHNLLSKADTHVRQIARDFPERPKFAQAQYLSNDVKLKGIYTDDVDICFVFEVQGVTMDVYANYKWPHLSGYVYTDDAALAVRLLMQHFGMSVEHINSVSGNVYYTATQKEEVAA